MTTPNNSTAPGYLSPVSTPPAEDADLDNLIQPVIVGITGLPGSLVRRKWQEIPPAQPARTVNWCAFGVSVTASDTNPTITHDGWDNGGLGSSTLSRTEFLEVSATFYGPACRSYATILRDGFGIGQNRDALRANGMAFVETDRIVLVPEPQNEQFIRRADVVFHLRRMSMRTYAIENIETLQATVVADSGSVTGPQDVEAFIETGI